MNVIWSVRAQVRGRWLVLATLALACGRGAQPARRPPVPAVLGDSVTIVRAPSAFGLGPAYRLRIARNGDVRFESRAPGDSGRVVERRLEPDSARALFRRASDLGLGELPADLMGKAPYCPIVATDHPAVVIGYYGAGFEHRVRDYLGCFEENDASGRGVLRELRAFTAAVERAAGVSRRLPPGARGALPASRRRALAFFGSGTRSTPPDKALQQTSLSVGLGLPPALAGERQDVRWRGAS